MAYAMYLRKSRADDGDESTDETLSRHKTALTEFACKNRLTIKKIYEEVVSGDKLVTRPQMIQLLDDVDNNMYAGVLCMDIDRLGRGSMSDQGIILETFKNSRTKIITPRKIYDLNNEFDEEYTEFETFMARRELKMISRRLHRGTEAAVKEGAFVSDPPFGYCRATVNKKSSLAIVEPEAKFIRMMFDMYVGGSGCQAIADAINSMGAKPRRAQQFGRTGIRGILKNPVYIGKVLWNKIDYFYENGRRHSRAKPKDQWMLVDGLHPAIISEEQFNRVQEIFENQWHPSYYTGQLVNPFAGIVKCSVCGRTLTYRTFQKTGPEPYMLCPTRQCCSCVHYDYFSAEFLRQVNRQLHNLETEYSKNDNSAADQIQQSIVDIKKQRDNTVTQKNRLYDLLEQQVYTIDVFNERMQAVNDKISTFDEQIAAAEDMLTKSSREGMARAISKIRAVLDAYDAAEPGTQNQLLKSIVTSATYYKQSGWAKDKFALTVSVINYC